MANIKNDARQVYNENSEAIVGKSVTNYRPSSVKKVAFADLKNVFHNQQCTPFKEAFSKRNEQAIRASASKLQPRKSILRNKEVVKVPFMQQEDFPEIPFSNYGCVSNCLREQQHLWSEMNKIDDDLLNLVLNGGKDEAEPIDFPPLLDMDDDLDDLKHLLDSPPIDGNIKYSKDDLLFDLKMPSIADFESDFEF